MLEHPMSQIRKGTIHRVTTGEMESITESCVHHYVQGLRLTRFDRVWQLAQQINAGVFDGVGRVVKTTIFDVLPEVEADVGYFDPPYPGVMSYEKEYKIIDLILEGQQRPTSPFTGRDGAAMIDGLLERASHIPVWALSLGNEVVTIGDLEEKMRRLGRETRAIEIRHQHLPAIATAEKKQRNREFLVVGWDPAAELFRSVHGIEVGHVTDGDLTHPVAEVEEQAHGGGAEATVTGALAQDLLDESHTSTAEQRVSGCGIESAAKAQARIDVPDGVGDEVAVDLDRELGFGVFRHEPKVARLDQHVKERVR